MREHDNLSEDGATLIEILVPIAFTFPNIGKITVILFVFFAGWFNGTPVELTHIPSLSVSGLLSLFGSVYVAIPFMLDLVHLPSDLFQLFVMAGFITRKFGSITAVMNLFALTLLTAALFQTRLRAPQLIKMGLGIVAYAEHGDAIEDVAATYPNIKFVKIDGYKNFFRQKDDKYDAMVISAQAGSAWSYESGATNFTLRALR